VGVHALTRGRAGASRADDARAREAAASVDALRREIDALDERLVALLNARAGCALAIGELKEALGLDVYQPDRERQVLEHVRRVNEGPLDGDAVARLFERIIDEARRLERLAQESGHRGGVGTPGED
jgi:chorismate mutase